MNKESKRIALTTKTLCEISLNIKCGAFIERTIGLNCCGEYGGELNQNKNGWSKRTKHCRDNFPGIIYMTAMKG